MIQNIRVNNFKSLRNVAVAVRPITILLGKNSSGKSSLLQSLLLLRQTLESRESWSPLVLRGGLVDLGSYDDFVYRHEKRREVTIEIELSPSLQRWRRAFLSLSVPGRPGQPLRQVSALGKRMAEVARNAVPNQRGAVSLPVKLAATFSYSTHRNRTALKELRYHLGNGKPVLRAKGRGKGSLVHDVSVLETYRNQPVMVTFRKCRVRKFHEPRIPWQVAKSFVHDLGGKQLKPAPRWLAERARNAADVFVSLVASAVEDGIRDQVLVGPSRDDPKRAYVFSGEARRDVGLRGEAAVEMFYSDVKGEKVPTPETATRLKRIRHWLKRLDMASKYGFPDIPGSAFVFKLQHTSQPVMSNVVDHGFGVSQVLPLLVQCFSSSPGSLLLMEQPEIHLHPKAQAVLAEMLVEVAKRGVRVVVETHSERIVERLQLLIARKKLPRDAVSLNLFEIGGRGTRVSKLELSEVGEEINWPADCIKDFFDGGYHDALAQEKLARVHRAGALRPQRSQK